MTNFGLILVVGLVPYVVCQIPGAPVETDANDVLINGMASFAVGEIGSEYELVRVISATKQVVNGMLYNIQLEAKRKIVGQENKRRRCNVLVYEIPHEGYLELEEFHCHFNNKQPRL